MTKLILMRHGETVSNLQQVYQGHGDSELSPKGIKQAEAAADFLVGLQINCIYSSTLIRSRQTATIISERLSKKAKAVDALKERCFGDWEGRNVSSLKKYYPALYATWLRDPDRAIIPGAETLKRLQNRAVRAVGKLIRKNRTTLIIGHGGINRVILFHYLGMDLNNFWKIKQDNCCINIIEFKGVKMSPRVALLNGIFFMGEKRLGLSSTNPLV